MSDKTLSESSSLWKHTRHFLAGSASGVALVLAGHPFDTIKVRLQTDGANGRFKGPIDCVRKTIGREGLRALYKGASPPMLMTGFINSVLFGMMGMCKARKEAQKGPLDVKDVMLCGVQTGVLLAFIVTPMELIKTRLQVQYDSGSKKKYNGPVDCARKIVRANGVKGLWRGITPTICHRGSNWAYFGGYDAARRYLATDNDKLSPIATVTAGAIGGTSFWLTCYPVDVIKGRMQAQADTTPLRYTGLVHCARTVYAEEGARAFFRGFTPCLVRSVPANAAAFMAFELTMKYLP